jgi:hypothetical protein
MMNKLDQFPPGLLKVGQTDQYPEGFLDLLRDMASKRLNQEVPVNTSPKQLIHLLMDSRPVLIHN